MKTEFTLIIMVLLFSFSTLVFAENLTLEFRPAFNLPTGEFDEAELDNGPGLEVRIAYRIMEHVDVFTGWSWTNFAAENDIDLEETGYDLGARFIHPVSDSKISYLLEAAATFKHVEIEDGDDIIGDSDHALGFQLGAGVVYPFNERFAVNPTVRYNSLTSEVEFDESDLKSEGDLNYISLGVGFSWKF